MKVLSETTFGGVAVDDGMIYLLTPCCAASGTGTGGGVACRGCYRPVGDIFGWAVMADDPGAVASVAGVVARGWADTANDPAVARFATFVVRQAQRIGRVPVVV